MPAATAASISSEYASRSGADAVSLNATAARAGCGLAGVSLARRLEPEARKDRVVEAVGAVQQFVDALEVFAGLRALDHAVIVGAGQRHDLLDPELAQRRIARVLQARRQRDRPGGDDRALAGHEPRYRRDRSDSARIGERETRAAQFVGDEFVLARFGDQLFVRGAELREVERVGPLDDRHDQKARTVFALRVDGQPEVHAVLDLRRASCRRAGNS